MAETAMSTVHAWRPAIRGVQEIFHANYEKHAYGPHIHTTWTLLRVDAGVIGYDLDGRDNWALTNQVILLPPRVPHDGHTVDARGFSKRVIYLSTDVLNDAYVGRSVDAPLVADPTVATLIDNFHKAASSYDEMAAESWLSFTLERLRGSLDAVEPNARVASLGAARLLRDVLEDSPTSRIVIEDVAASLHVSATHLNRAFRRHYGISPHRYLVARRVEVARQLLLRGVPIGQAAVDAGFHDQAHLSRHFKALTGLTPGAYRRATA